MPEERVVVKLDFCVQGEQLILFIQHPRINFDTSRIRLNEQAVQIFQRTNSLFKRL